MKIKRVIQEDSTGCGIACIAMVAGISYAEAKQITLNNEILKKSVKNFYTTTKDLVNVLNSIGIESSKGRKVRYWSSINTISIVGINFLETTDTWHWVLFIPNEDTGYVLDPSKRVKTEKRTDFSRMRLRSYIPISLP
ncbi:hypothetical protein HYI04_10685 [Acinetobacter sp. SwsAc2]|uniref:cysteine peptidase family C39 domain-containing protein n=1 Tax=Acinetobacter sp. SwsAc2 TaxID=2749360 RepID=UPI0015BDE192|nr:cysteine peptidase family C39 domain-containing protein [Acinetobacter sp. SwsAc2]NWK59845.1 hypothetical protein [Acinetobacter sp. SwsAc2]